jgi:hypothetical protein
MQRGLVPDYSFDHYEDDEDDDDYDSNEDEDEEEELLPAYALFSAVQEEHSGRKVDAYLRGEAFPEPPPALPAEEAAHIVQRLRQLCEIGAFEQEVYGSYYHILQNIGYPLDPYSDSNLLSREHNVSAGWVHNSVPDSEVVKMEKISAKGHFLTLTFARLSQWAARLGPALRAPVPRLQETFSVDWDCSVNVDSPDCDFSDGDIEQAKEIANLQCLGQAIMQHQGLYWLIKRPKPNTRLEINIDILTQHMKTMKSYFAEVEESGQKTLPIAKIPGASAKQINIIIETAFVQCVAEISRGIQEGILLFDIAGEALGMIAAAVRASDVCSAAPVAAHIGGMLRATVRSMLGAPSPAAAAQAEAVYLHLMSLYAAYSERFDASNEPSYLQYRSPTFVPSEKANTFAAIILAMAPACMDAVASTSNPIASYLALDLLSVVAHLGLPDEVPMFLLKKKNWKIFEKFILADPSDESDDASTFLHHYRMDVLNHDDNTTHTIHTPRQLLAHNQKVALRLLTRLCHRGLMFDTSALSPVVMLGPVGTQLVSRGIVALALTLLQRSVSSTEGSSFDRTFLAKNAVECLNCLTRSRDCRMAMLSTDVCSGGAGEGAGGEGGGSSSQQLVGENTLRLLLTHASPAVVSHGVMVAMHLLWDPEWQQVCAGMAPPSLVHMTGVWAAAAIQTMERTAAARRAMFSVKMRLSIRRPKPDAGKKKKKGKPESKPAEQEKRAQEEIDFDKYCARFPPDAWGMRATGYPAFEDRQSDALVLLSRCALLFQNVSPMHIPVASPAHADVKRARVTELLTACLDLDFIDIDCYAIAGLQKFAIAEDFKPEDIPNPQAFMDFFMEMLYCSRYVRYDQLPSVPSAQTMQALMSITCKLTESPLAELWAPYVEPAKDKLKGVLGAGAVADHWERLMKTFREGAGRDDPRPIASDRGQALRDMQQKGMSPRLMELQVFNECANCRKVEVRKKSFPVCGQCRAVYYCGIRWVSCYYY